MIKGEHEMYDSKNDTIKHIVEVSKTIGTITDALDSRAKHHDKSKMESPEKEIFDIVTPRLQEVTYGSEEYKKNLSDMGKALNHHYENNRHHPEHFAEDARALSCLPIDCMDLVDIVEMFCDWCAATKRHADGDIYKSLKIQKKKLFMPETLYRILVNTAKNHNLGKIND